MFSDSTAALDRGRKFEAYRNLDTPEAYLLIEQQRCHADLFVRNAERTRVLTPFLRGGQPVDCDHRCRADH